MKWEAEDEISFNIFLFFDCWIALHMCRVLTVIFVILEKTPEYIFIRFHLVFVVINEQLIHAQCWGYSTKLSNLDSLLSADFLSVWKWDNSKKMWKDVKRISRMDTEVQTRRTTSASNPDYNPDPGYWLISINRSDWELHLGLYQIEVWQYNGKNEYFNKWMYW